MPSLEHISRKNNLQMQEWVKQKIELCDSQLKLWNLRFNDRSYLTSLSYINYQIAKYTLEKEYFNYFIHLLEVEHEKLVKKQKNDFKQIKI